LSAVLIYPNTRDVALASLGFLKVFQLLKDLLQLVDMSYLPGPEDPIVSPKQGLLLGEATGDEVSRFDIVAFSISYENDYLHVAELLLKAGIPPLAADRSAGHPFVILGGFTMSLNPLPVADLADVVVVGEFEVAADGLVDTIWECGSSGVSKSETLDRLAAIEGVYVPSRGEHPVRRLWCDAERIADLEFGFGPSGRTGPGGSGGSAEADAPGSHFGDMFLVETGRGCGRGCLFCAAGNVYRPVRMREAESILQSTASYRRVGLVGTAVGDHPGLTTIIDSLLSEGRTAGISSLRADQVKPELADRLAGCGIKTIAIAPEAGTEDLRSRIGKRITERQIVDAVRMLSAAGIANIKLYFMIGLPGETDKDVKAIVSLIDTLSAVKGKSRLSVGAGPFVPKPHTAFQWAGFAPRETLRRRIKLLKPINRLKGCTLRVGSIDEAWSEAVLARGDRSLSGTLLEAARSGRPLKALLRKAGYDPCLELDTVKPLPWDFLDCGVSMEALLKQYQKSNSPER
jgi:radical SAM superfamily enzyme YgiQ (UPF0313 family)